MQTSTHFIYLLIIVISKQ